eukprot:TRINITY_DN3007_c0_g1_i1.p1 TRINITY_DN3007_c0_g1~~TRINITY_DN3007_c0_g1_i1.p1  ORF type:complete len:142 (-),score=46.76 TRINITY_DN3007_c0_g1_i1:213-638(-)
MSMSGIEVDAELVKQYNDFKMDKTSTRYMVFKITDDFKKIVVESKGPINSTWNEFVEKEMGADNRYAVFKFEFTTSNGPRGKMLFVLWSPEASKIKHKMVYAASKDAVKKALTGVQVEVGATDKSELDFQCVLEKCAQFDK